MVQRCKNCGRKIIKFPLWEGQEDGMQFSWDKVKWLNLFKIDWYTIVWIFVVIFLIFGYRQDISQCKDAIEKPCEFCDTTGCCQVDWARIRPNYPNMNISMPNDEKQT